MKKVFAAMEQLRQDGWCVVLKCLPPGFPWLAPGDPSEYGGGSSDTPVSEKPWCAECQDMLPGKSMWDFRHSQFADGSTPQEAMTALVRKVKEEERRKAAKAGG